MAHLGVRLSGGLVDARQDVAPVAGVVQRWAAGEHPCAVVALPPEEVARQVLLDARGGAEEDVIAQPAVAQDLGQAPRMAEGVDVVAGYRPAAEHGLQAALAVQTVTDEGLAAGDVAVGLHPPSVDQGPAALGHPRLDGGEHGRVILLYPAIGDRAPAGEDEVGGLLHAFQGGAIGGEHLRASLAHAPQPHRVDVGIAYHVHDDWPGVIHAFTPLDLLLSVLVCQCTSRHER